MLLCWCLHVQAGTRLLGCWPWLLPPCSHQKLEEGEAAPLGGVPVCNRAVISMHITD